MSLDVARSQGLREVALATGGKSERLLKELRPGLPDTARIQVADFFAFSLREAVKHGMESVHVACFFGKLVKMAQGHPYTHARRSRIDFSDLAAWCENAGLDPERLSVVSRANTSREALGVIRQDPASGAVMEEVLKRAAGAARAFLGPGPRLAYYLFDFDESLLGTWSDEPVTEEKRP